MEPERSAYKERDAAYRTGAPIDWGVVDFIRHRRSARSDFLRIPDTADQRHLLRFLRLQWRLPEPGILLHITGSAQGFDLPSKLVLPVTEGVVHASMTARAWIITGGMDSGVMSLIGNAIARQKHKCKGPLLGVAPWRGVQERERLEGAKGGKAQYAASEANNRKSAGLEPNHTHFLLVDQKPQGEDDSPWGGEMNMLERLNHELFSAFACPMVLVVVQVSRQAGSGPAQNRTNPYSYPLQRSRDARPQPRMLRRAGQARSRTCCAASGWEWSPSSPQTLASSPPPSPSSCGRAPSTLRGSTRRRLSRRSSGSTWRPRSSTRGTPLIGGRSSHSLLQTRMALHLPADEELTCFTVRLLAAPHSTRSSSGRTGWRSIGRC